MPHLFLCPGKVRKFLRHVWTSQPLWFSMPSLGMDPLPFRHLPGRLPDSHSSIKVYLSAVRSLHVDQGFPDPLENCLQLQRVVRGIKRSQGALPSRPRLPVSSNILRIIYSALNLNSFDDVMFWAACLLAYFGFLRSAEFTVPSLSAYNASIHLPMSDVSVDVPLNPACLQVFIKASKTDPFRKGCNILIGLGSPLVWVCYPSCGLLLGTSRTPSWRLVPFGKWSSTNSLTDHGQVKSHSPFCWSPR